jgi:hypothetical protein
VPQEGGLPRFGSSAALAQCELILTRFRAALDEIYGPRIERVVLFGSRTWRCRCSCPRVAA